MGDLGFFKIIWNIQQYHRVWIWYKSHIYYENLKLNIRSIDFILTIPVNVCHPLVNSTNEEFLNVSVGSVANRWIQNKFSENWMPIKYTY